MQQSVGEVIRQLRRQRSLTQTELGGDRFSKSYVSAVEREKIVPSAEALHFFATQLDQTHDYFLTLAQQTEQESRELTAQGQEEVQALQTGLVALLDSLVRSAEQAAAPLLFQLPTLSKEALAAFPREKQAEYAFLAGLSARQSGETTKALISFEQALALASQAQLSMILDEMGLTHYQTHEYETALLYHKRALNAVKEMIGTPSTFSMRIHLHCGNDYRALGAYKQARTHYEETRQHLNVQCDVKTIAHVYLGLGYCTYAYVYQHTMPSDSAMSSAQSMSSEEMESDFQRALSFLVQSRMLYQTCNNLIGESLMRLMQAMVILDFCTRRKQMAQKNSSPLALKYNAYLDEAEEQCRQVLISWHDSLIAGNPLIPQLEDIFYTALAYLTRVIMQRAIVAKLGNYVDTTERERMRAVQLCQQLLDALTQPAISWDLVQDALTQSGSIVVRHSLSLPHLPDVSRVQAQDGSLPQGKLEVYYATGEVMEELGRTATTPDYAVDCYKRADYCFQKTLTPSEKTMIDSEQDAGDRMRRYQRYISVLEERYTVAPVYTEETIKTLLNVLKEGLILHQSLATL